MADPKTLRGRLIKKNIMLKCYGSHYCGVRRIKPLVVFGKQSMEYHSEVKQVFVGHHQFDGLVTTSVYRLQSKSTGRYVAVIFGDISPKDTCLKP